MKSLVVILLFPLASLAQDKIEIGSGYMPMIFVKIQAGSFYMGSPLDEKDRSGNETQHQVTLTHDFEMQITPVTQRQFFQLSKEKEVHKAFFSGKLDCPISHEEIAHGLCPNRPMEGVSWFDALYFANQISIRRGLKPCYQINQPREALGLRTGGYSLDGGYTGINSKSVYECQGYRIPTEAEWEYAVRAGTTTPYFFESDPTPSRLDLYSIWILNNPGNRSQSQTADVASLDPNPWGLYDVIGNVQQWIQDNYSRYEALPPTDPVADTPNSMNRVLRGGDFISNVDNLRSAARSSMPPWDRTSNVGIRLVRTLK